MDILLTHGYFLEEDDAEKRVMKPYPTLGILSLSAYLKHQGFSVDVFDTTFRRPADFQRWIETQPPGVAGLSVNLMTKLNVLAQIRFLKGRGWTVVVGGPDVPAYAEEYLRHGADVAVLGEGELTIAELLPALTKRLPLGAIAGIAFRDDRGFCVRTAPRALIPDLDRLPLPDREAIDVEQYMRVWRAHHGRGPVSLITARGCPFSCTWCSRSVYGETHRRRSPTHVVDEIAYLQERYRPDMLWFADDVFTISHKWFHDFHTEMKRREIRIPFECISRADRLNDEVLAKMAELGSFRIWFGSESGSQRILDAMERQVSVEEIRHVTRLAQRHGIEAGLFVMLGYPGEEIADIEATVDHLKRTAPDTFLTTVAYPIKGTPFHARHATTSPPDDPAWADGTDRTASVPGRHSDRFYWFATRYLVNEVRRQIQHEGSGRGSVLTRTALLAKAKLARMGMTLTNGERS